MIHGHHPLALGPPPARINPDASPRIRCLRLGIAAGAGASPSLDGFPQSRVHETIVAFTIVAGGKKPSGARRLSAERGIGRQRLSELGMIVAPPEKNATCDATAGHRTRGGLHRWLRGPHDAPQGEPGSRACTDGSRRPRFILRGGFSRQANRQRRQVRHERDGSRPPQLSARDRRSSDEPEEQALGSASNPGSWPSGRAPS